MENAKVESQHKNEKPNIAIELLLSKAWKIEPVQQDKKGNSVIEIKNSKDTLYLLVKQSKTKTGRVSYRIRLYNDKDKALKKLVA